MAVKKLTVFESLWSLWLLIWSNLGTVIAAIVAAGGAVIGSWKYIQLAAALEGWWVYPVVIVLLFGALIAIIATVRWIWWAFVGNQKEPQKQEPNDDADTIKQQRLMLKEQRAHQEHDQATARRQVADKLADFYADGVRERNRVRIPMDNFDYIGERQTLVAWSSKAVRLMKKSPEVTVKERMNFKTLNKYDPEYQKIPYKTPKQNHIESMWNEKLKRLEAIINRIGG